MLFLALIDTLDLLKTFTVCVCHVSTGKTTGIPIHVFGTETHMTAIVGMALGHRPIPKEPPVAAHTANFLLNSSASSSVGYTRPIISFRAILSFFNAVKNVMLLFFRIFPE